MIRNKRQLDLEQRIVQLESKVVDQERTIHDLRDDVKSLKTLQDGDRQESREEFNWHKTKKEKLYALLVDSNKIVATLNNNQEQFVTKHELVSLSNQVQGLKTHVDRITAGMYTSGLSPPSDLIELSPARSLINFEDSTKSSARSPVGSTQTPSPSRLSTPIRPAKILSDRSSMTAGGLSPVVRIATSVKRGQLVEEEPLPQRAKKVRFDIDKKQAELLISESGSEDPLAINATLRKNMSGKQTMKAAVSDKTSPTVAGTIIIPLHHETEDILQSFKEGRLESESDEEDSISTQAVPSDNTDATFDLAEKAVTLVRRALPTELTDQTTTATRRSARARKPKDFGDVQTHGWPRSSKKQRN